MTPPPTYSAFPVALVLLAFAFPVWGQTSVKPIQPSGQNAPAAAPSGSPEKAAPKASSTAPAKNGTAAATPAEPMKYVVKVGDNPWKIAKNHGISLDELLRANKIRDSKKLGIGDILLLPPGVESKGAPEESTETAPKMAASAALRTPSAGDNWEIYTVKKGDNPWKIAKRLKVDHQKVLSLNKGLDFTKLKIGQQIKVPKQ